MVLTLLELIRKYNPHAYPVSNFSVDYLDEIPQDVGIHPDNVFHLAEKNQRNSEEIIKVNNGDNHFNRSSTFFNYFLDGCQRSYYICDVATSGGNMLPILAGQISSAVTERKRQDGRMKLHKYERDSILLLPVGGKGFPQDDAAELKEKIEKSFTKEKLKVIFVTLGKFDTPKNDALAKINAEMHNLEVKFLDEMTHVSELSQNNMVVVDGALQFQNVKKDKISNLRYAIGISKHFNLHLTNIISKTKEIGTLLIRLSKVGERTPAYRLKLDSGAQYGFWYLRIRQSKFLSFPFAGIIKIEKALIAQDEKEDGLDKDTIDNISKCALKETSVTAYGNDFRWASHLYPIYLTEQVQKKKFITDYFFRNILRRRLDI